jgi:phosphoribosyl 1,2-cyclic phosphate phosphodiesterase
MNLRFLGTGNAGGVPLYGCRCPACARAWLTKDRQRHAACALLETSGARLLLDAGLAGMGERFPAGSIDAVLLTHYHMDHVQGLFPIRWGTDVRVKVIGPDDPVGCDDLFKHPGILDFGTKAQAFESFRVGDLRVTPLPLNHSRPTLGYAFEHAERRIAYLTDTCGLPAETEEWLLGQRPDVLILDCSHPPRTERPRNHNDLNMALRIFERLQPRHCYLTHIDHRFDAWLLEHAQALPAEVEVAHDDQVLVI